MDEIPLSAPDITESDILYVLDVLRSGRLALGPYAMRFEEALATRLRRRHAVAVSSGTAALHLALVALGVSEGDEVITSAFTFIAPANAILYVGATPVLVDICPRSLNMDPKSVEEKITDRTKAIIAVENFGNPAYMRELRRIADRHEIQLIEDACEGIGGAIAEGNTRTPIGGFGHISVFGFYPNKQITAGEGGMLVTDNERIADLARSMRNQGRPSGSADQTATGAVPAGATKPTASASDLGAWMSFARLGYNYRLSELQAALGLAQVKRLDEIVEKRARVAQRYTDLLLDNTDLILPSVDPGVTMSWFVYVVRLTDQYTREERDRIIAGLHRHDVGAAAYFPPIHLQPQFREHGYSQGDFPITESISGRTIALPFHSNLTEREQSLVVQTLAQMIQREQLNPRNG